MGLWRKTGPDDQRKKLKPLPFRDEPQARTDQTRRRMARNTREARDGSPRNKNEKRHLLKEFAKCFVYLGFSLPEIDIGHK